MNRRVLIGIVLSLMLCGVIGVAWWTLHPRVPGQPPEGTHIAEKSPADETARQDWLILRDHEAPPNAVAGALMRLGARQDAEALPRITDSLKSPSPILRAAGAKALGYYGEAQTGAAMSTALADSDESVRIGALQGLAVQRGSTREKWVSGHLQHTGLSSLERLETYAALAVTSVSAETRDQALEHLAEFVRGHDVQLGRLAAFKMMGLAGQSPRTLEMAKAILASSHDPEMISTAIRHLAGFEPKWIRDRLNSWRTHAAREVRVAVVQSMTGACPSDRWTTLRSMLRDEHDPVVADALLDEPLQMPGRDAEEYLNWAKAYFKESQPTLSQRAAVNVVRLEHARNSDPCGGNH